MSKTGVSRNTIRARLICMIVLIILGSLILIFRMVWIQAVWADELQQKAWTQWNRSIPAVSLRGSIRDRRGNLLAGSSMAETVAAIPAQVENPRDTARQLASILDMEASRLEELMSSSRAFIYLKRKIDKDTAQRVRELDLPGITFTPEGKRFYPHGKLASQLLGFVGMDQGWSGLELYYEKKLQGREGRMFFPSDAKDRPIPHEVKRFNPPRDGYDLFLTIDKTIQYIVEREIERALIEYRAERVMALAVDPITGEVLAVAGKPDFDPARYNEYDSRLWALSPLTNTFEPGSTFKLATLMAAVEEGLYNGEKAFFCAGYVKIADRKINCWTSRKGGHGSINFLKAIHDSCNPALIALGQKVGREKLFAYLKSFGYGAQSGIDYPGEGAGIIFNPEQMGPVELATTSFGQGISVTPLQQVMMVSAVANGGYLMEPYIVKEIQNSAGEIIRQARPQMIRQAISQETARKVAEIMESTVAEGGGINAYIEGYRVAGKTGTAQKVGPGGRYLTGQYILSFVGFVPVEDPQVVLYIAVEGATRGSLWGSQISAPIFHRVMKDVLNYLGTNPRQDYVLPGGGAIETPDLTGMTLDEANQLMHNQGVLFRKIGAGNKIIKQTPPAGTIIPLHSRIIIYLGGQELPDGQVIVPYLGGLTIDEAVEIMQWLGLTMQINGTGFVVEQYPDADIAVEKGSEVKVIFRADNNRQ